MVDVGAGLRPGQGGQMKTQTYALRELSQLRRVQLVVQLGLSGKNNAQHLFLGGLHARQHAHFLEHAVAQVLRLIDDEQYLASVAVLFRQKLIERREHFRLFHVERRKAELHEDALQKRGGRQLRLVDLRHDRIALQFTQEGL